MDGSVTPNFCVRVCERECKRECVRKLQDCSAPVANEICSLIGEEQKMRGRGRCRGGRREMSGRKEGVREKNRGREKPGD